MEYGSLNLSLLKKRFLLELLAFHGDLLPPNDDDDDDDDDLGDLVSI